MPSLTDGFVMSVGETLILDGVHFLVDGKNWSLSETGLSLQFSDESVFITGENLDGLHLSNWDTSGFLEALSASPDLELVFQDSENAFQLVAGGEAVSLSLVYSDSGNADTSYDDMNTLDLSGLEDFAFLGADLDEAISGGSWRLIVNETSYIPGDDSSIGTVATSIAMSDELPEDTATSATGSIATGDSGTAGEVSADSPGTASEGIGEGGIDLFDGASGGTEGGTVASTATTAPSTDTFTGDLLGVSEDDVLTGVSQAISATATLFDENGNTLNSADNVLDQTDGNGTVVGADDGSQQTLLVDLQGDNYIEFLRFEGADLGSLEGAEVQVLRDGVVVGTVSDIGSEGIHYIGTGGIVGDAVAIRNTDTVIDVQEIVAYGYLNLTDVMDAQASQSSLFRGNSESYAADHVLDNDEETFNHTKKEGSLGGTPELKINLGDDAVLEHLSIVNRHGIDDPSVEQLVLDRLEGVVVEVWDDDQLVASVGTLTADKNQEIDLAGIVGDTIVFRNNFEYLHIAEVDVYGSLLDGYAFPNADGAALLTDEYRTGITNSDALRLETFETTLSEASLDNTNTQAGIWALALANQPNEDIFSDLFI